MFLQLVNSSQSFLCPPKTTATVGKKRCFECFLYCLHFVSGGFRKTKHALAAYSTCTNAVGVKKEKEPAVTHCIIAKTVLCEKEVQPKNNSTTNFPCLAHTTLRDKNCPIANLWGSPFLMWTKLQSLGSVTLRSEECKARRNLGEIWPTRKSAEKRLKRIGFDGCKNG